MTRIQHLPEATRSSIRSGVVVCDLTTIVEELVYNSLDAGATKVTVAIGINSCYVKVADNGSGIMREGLMLLGEHYATSKFDRQAAMDSINGSCGESLLSISGVSSLEIVTKARGKAHGYRKIIKNCKCLNLGICDEEQNVGTTVSARDIFYNQPVRQKQLKSSPKKVLDLIRMSVLRIALVHMKVSFKMFDVESGDELLRTEPSSSPLSLLSSNFGIEYSNTLHKLNVSDGELKLSGYISGPQQILPLKEIQYFYINSRFICTGPMHKLVNQLAAKFDATLSTSFHCEKKNKLGLGPTFILNLTCPKYYYDITNAERSRTSVELKDWVPILSLIEDGVIRAWTEDITHGKDMANVYENVKKRSRKPQTSPDCDGASDWDETLFSYGQPSKRFCTLKKLPNEVGLLSEANCLSPYYGYSGGCKVIPSNEITSHVSTLAHGQVEACIFDKNVDAISSSAYRMDNISTPNRVSGNFHEFDCDVRNVQHPRKSFLRSCSHERNWLHEGNRTESDPIFEFGDDDIGMKTEWSEGVNRRNNTSKISSISDGEINDRSIFFTRDLVTSSLLLENVLPESSGRELDQSSRLPFLMSEGSPVREKSFQIDYRGSDDDAINGNVSGGYFGFREDIVNRYDDAINGNVSGGHFGFHEDIVNKYLDWREDEDLKCLDSNAEDSWPQHYSFADITLRNSSYDTWQMGELHCGDFQNLSCSTPLKDSTKVDLSPLPPYGKRTPDNYSVHTLVDSRHPMLERGRPMFNRRKSVRSQSAPPFHKRKQRYLDLTYSSALLSAKGNFGNANRLFSLKESSNRNYAHFHLAAENPICLQKPILQSPQSPKERLDMDCELAERTCSEPRSKAMERNAKSKKRCEAVDTESDDRGDLKEFQDDSLKKWRSCSSPAVGGTFHSNETQNTVLDISSDVLHLSGDSLVPKLIDRNSLEDAKVLNQVDKKFIPVVAGKTLAIIDQHAADERIRLEDLRQKVLLGEMKTITYLNDEQILVLPEIGYQLLDHYADQIQDWGWICNIHCNKETSFTKNLNFLHKQPTIVKLLAVPTILGVNLNDTDLLEFLQQLADTDGSSTMPPSVNRILNNKACRGAIMFGDTLLHSECSLIVEELKRTSLCFQCAHGRPTTVPLVSLNLLHDKIAKLGSNGRAWNGLRRHKISVERATQRLRSALS